MNSASSFDTNFVVINFIFGLHTPLTMFFQNDTKDLNCDLLAKIFFGIYFHGGTVFHKHILLV